MKIYTAEVGVFVSASMSSTSDLLNLNSPFSRTSKPAMMSAETRDQG